MTGRSSESVRAVRAVVGNPDLRRLQAAWALLWVADWAYLVALGIFAFKAGGSFGVGLAGLIRMFPSALVAPFASMMRDRYPWQRKFLRRAALCSRVLAASAVALLEHGPTDLLFGLGA